MKLTEYWRLRYRDPHTAEAAASAAAGLEAVERHRMEPAPRDRGETRVALHKDFEDTMPRVFHPELLG